MLNKLLQVFIPTRKSDEIVLSKKGFEYFSKEYDMMKELVDDQKELIDNLSNSNKKLLGKLELEQTFSKQDLTNKINNLNQENVKLTKKIEYLMSAEKLYLSEIHKLKQNLLKKVSTSDDHLLKLINNFTKDIKVLDEKVDMSICTIAETASEKLSRVIDDRDDLLRGVMKSITNLNKIDITI